MTTPADRPGPGRAAARARTMTWAALLLLLVAGMVGAPEAGVAVAGLAALAAITAIASGAGRWRLAGVLLLLAALGLAWSLWPAAATRAPSGPPAAPRP